MSPQSIKVITLHVNVKEQMGTLLHMLLGIKMTERLATQKKRLQRWFSVMYIKVTVGRTGVKLKLELRI